MRRIKSTGTSPEWAVRRLVHAMGFRYRLHVARLPGKPDIVITRLRKIIEVRGCFWHQHSKCVDCHMPKSRKDYWRPKLLRNKKRDKVNALQLQAAGWKVLIIWECEIKDDRALRKRLERFLGSSSNQARR